MFLDSKTIATLVTYMCKSFIKLTQVDSDFVDLPLMTVTYSSVARSPHPLMKLSRVQVHVTPWKFSRLLFWFNLTWSYGDKFFIYFHQAFSTWHKWIANQRRGIEWFPEKTRVSENFCPISKSQKQLWYISKPCFQVTLCLGVSNFFKAWSGIFKPGTSLVKSQIYHSILLGETELFLDDIIFITVKPRSLHHVGNS